MRAISVRYVQLAFKLLIIFTIYNNHDDSLYSHSQNADVILTDLASAIKQIFPTVPLKYIIKKASTAIVSEKGN